MLWIKRSETGAVIPTRWEIVKKRQVIDPPSSRRPTDPAPRGVSSPPPPAEERGQPRASTRESPERQKVTDELWPAVTSPAVVAVTEARQRKATRKGWSYREIREGVKTSPPDPRLGPYVQTKQSAKSNVINFLRRQILFSLIFLQLVLFNQWSMLSDCLIF